VIAAGERARNMAMLFTGVRHFATEMRFLLSF
jgi:hypothetical protein